MVRRLAVVAAALSLGLAGCGSDTGSGSSTGSGTTTTAEAKGGDAVAWAESVCSKIGPEVEALSKTPEIDSSDPAKTKDSMVSYLTTLSTALGKMSSGIEDAGTPPVADGKVLADKVVGGLGEAKKAVDTAKENLSTVDASDPAKFQEGFQKVSADLSKIGDMEDPTKGLRGNQELEDAFKNAESCKKLDAIGGASSSAPSASSAAPTS
ncbi:MAG: hypothetical protein M3548_23605 [Actinomycetota bacterium]|nr:hypothetical protein [Actinomycetota bacterium]